MPRRRVRCTLAVIAGYGMLDFELTQGLARDRRRSHRDTRSEARLRTRQFPGFPDLPDSRIDVVDWLPAALDRLLTDQEHQTPRRLRPVRSLDRRSASWRRSRTRPISAAIPFAGNPDLKLTYINNFDTRFEYYPTLREVLAFSFFYKTFQDPIENIVVGSGSTGIIQPQNRRARSSPGSNSKPENRSSSSEQDSERLHRHCQPHARAIADRDRTHEPQPRHESLAPDGESGAVRHQFLARLRERAPWARHPRAVQRRGKARRACRLSGRSGLLRAAETHAGCHRFEGSRRALSGEAPGYEPARLRYDRDARAGES